MPETTKLILSFAAGLVAALVLIFVSVNIVIISGSIDPGADQPTPEWERWAAKTALRAHLMKAVPKLKNPLQRTDENLQNGAKVYLNNCAVCHGFADGKASNITLGLYKQPPLISVEDWSRDEEELIYWYINHGVRFTGMPSFNKNLSDDEMWQAAMFVKRMRHLPPSVKEYWQSAKSQPF